MLVKHSGLWKEATPLVKEAGAWKPVAAAYVKEGGVWKETYAPAPAGPSGPMEFWPTNMTSTQWTNPMNALTDNGVYATRPTEPRYTTSYLYAHFNNLAGQIPPTAKLKGLELVVEARAQYSASLRFLRGYLRPGSFLYQLPTQPLMSSTLKVYSIGGPTDLWGYTAEELMAALLDPGCNLTFDAINSDQYTKVTMYVDYMKLILHF